MDKDFWRCWSCKKFRSLMDFPTPCLNCGCRVLETVRDKTE